jgi:hypothetical protein
LDSSAASGAPSPCPTHNASSRAASASAGSAAIHLKSSGTTASAPRSTSTRFAIWRVKSSGAFSASNSSGTGAPSSFGHGTSGRPFAVTRQMRPCVLSRRGSRKSTSPCWMIGLYQSAMYSAPSGPIFASIGRNAGCVLRISGSCSRLA